MREKNPISSPSLSVSPLFLLPQEALVKVMEDDGRRGEPERGTEREKESDKQTELVSATLCSFCLALLRFYFQREVNLINPKPVPMGFFWILSISWFYLNSLGIKKSDHQRQISLIIWSMCWSLRLKARSHLGRLQVLWPHDSLQTNQCPIRNYWQVGLKTTWRLLKRLARCC